MRIIAAAEYRIVGFDGTRALNVIREKRFFGGRDRALAALTARISVVEDEFQERSEHLVGRLRPPEHGLVRIGVVAVCD
jgi:hypothetical protein